MDDLEYVVIVAFVVAVQTGVYDHNFRILSKYLFRPLASHFSLLRLKKSNQKKGDPSRSCFLCFSENYRRSDARGTRMGIVGTTNIDLTNTFFFQPLNIRRR